MKLAATVKAVWSKTTSVKTTQSLSPQELIKRPVLLGLSMLVFLVIITGGGYWYHASHYNYLNASLRDSCGASELLIGVRGSGETGDMIGGLGNIVGSVEHQFSNDMRPIQVAGAPVDYEAIKVTDIRQPSDYDNSYTQGVQQTYNALYYWNHHCPNYRFVISGYSQGADAVGQVMAGLNPNNPTELQILNKIDGVALIADPKYNPSLFSINANGQATRPGMLSFVPSNHAGIRPAFPSYLNGRIRSWCRVHDPVCQATDTCMSNGSGIASLASCIGSIYAHVSEHGAYIGGGETAAAGAWLADRVKHPYIPQPSSQIPIIRPPTQSARPSPNPSLKSVTSTPQARNTVKAAPTTPETTVKKYNVPPLAPVPTPPAPPPPPDRVAITSYNRMQPGAPHHGYFDVAWQDFVAQSNTITYLSATVGSPGGAAGTPVGVPLTIRLCTSPSCGTVLAQTSPQIDNYGETGSDIGDIHVTPGATYYIVWYQPAQLNGNTWVTYWWAGGSTLASSDQMQAVARGYNK